jgi:hypothetical protein
MRKQGYSSNILDLGTRLSGQLHAPGLNAVKKKKILPLPGIEPLLPIKLSLVRIYGVNVLRLRGI